MDVDTPLLPYARANGRILRFEGPFVLWSAATGLLATTGVIADLVRHAGFNQFVEFAGKLRAFAWDWSNVDSLAWTAEFCLLSLAGVLLLAAVLIARKSRWAISPASQWSIRAAGIALGVNAGLQMASFIGLMKLSRTPDMPMFDLVGYFAAEFVQLAIPVALVLASSFRRFHGRPALGRKLVAGLALGIGVPMVLVFGHQGMQWVHGTPPPWLAPVDPQYAKYLQQLPTIEARLLNFQRVALPPISFVVAVLAIVVGINGLLGTRSLRRWYLGFAVAWLLPLALDITLILVQMAGNLSDLNPYCGRLLANAFLALMSVLAWTGLAEHRDQPAVLSYN